MDRATNMWLLTQAGVKLLYAVLLPGLLCV